MAFENPLVSVVIPTRNRPNLLMRAIRSVLDQTYENFEIVVVVDGPDEQTVDTLSSHFVPKLRFLALVESVGRF